jgi:hypothetical protein
MKQKWDKESRISEKGKNKREKYFLGQFSRLIIAAYKDLEAQGSN